jgi:hypothetical protein
VTPPHAPGRASVTVRLADGHASNAVPFQYDATPPPVIQGSSAKGSPHGPDVGGTPVVLRGDNLDQGTVFVDGTPVATHECNRTSRGAISLCFVTPPHAPGHAAITVHTPDGAVSNAISFTYVDTPAPRIARLTPAKGPDVGGTGVRVSGANLDQGVVLVDEVRVATEECGRQANSGRSTTVELCFTTPPHTPGNATVTVATPNGKASNGMGFLYEETPAPVITSIRPPTASTTGGTAVTVVGANVPQGARDQPTVHPLRDAAGRARTTVLRCARARRRQRDGRGSQPQRQDQQRGEARVRAPPPLGQRPANQPANDGLVQPVPVLAGAVPSGVPPYTTVFPAASAW